MVLDCSKNKQSDVYLLNFFKKHVVLIILMDIDKVADDNGKQIDEKIKPLVSTLWKLGYETTSSCEGHTDWGRGYPWIELAESQDFEVINDRIEAYNKLKLLPWEFVENPIPGLHAYTLYPIITSFTTISLKGESVIVPRRFSNEELRDAQKSIQDIVQNL